MFNKIIFIVISTFLVFATAEIDDDIKSFQNTVGEIPGFDASKVPSVEDAAEIMKKKCIKEADEAAYNKIVTAKDDFQKCLTSLINFETIKQEIEDAKPTGDLDVVFKKYCRKTPQFKTCVANLTHSIEPCLNEKERGNTRIVLNITESLANFICYKEGDRIALFIAEGGPECLMDKQEAIQGCVNSTMSKYLPKETPSLENLPEFVLQDDQCRDMLKLQDCIVKELESCEEPTPSNIAESLFKFIRQVTPCHNVKADITKRDRSPVVEKSVAPNSAASLSITWFLVALAALHLVKSDSHNFALC